MKLAEVEDLVNDWCVASGHGLTAKEALSLSEKIFEVMEEELAQLKDELTLVDDQWEE